MSAATDLPRHVRFIRDAARALGAAHARGRVHGDLRPSCLVLRPDETVEVLGWARGSSRRLPDTEGTEPLYLPPETLDPRTRTSTPASDVWSLALMLYTRVLGRHPFAGLDAAELIARAEQGVPSLASQVPGVLPALDAAVRRGLAFSPAARQQDGEALARELDVLLGPLEDQASTLATQKRVSLRETLQPGVSLGPYTIVGLLGQGGMGQVFRARDERLGREVALKVLRGDRESTNRAERFVREIEAASRVSHRNIVAVHAGGEANGIAYLVSELVAGETLDTLIQRTGPLAPARVAEIGARLASALAALHAAGVLHRDVKPANVLVDEAGEPRLTDFGLARLDDAAKITMTGALLGTPMYAPLEQLEGGDVDERSDIYGLGVLLYESLTGQPPFPADELLNTVAAKMSLPEPPSRLRDDHDRSLDAVVLRCLEPRPERRFPSARDLEWACHEARTDPPRGSSPAVRRLLLALLVVALALAGVALSAARGTVTSTARDADLALLDSVAARRTAARSLRVLDLSDLIAALSSTSTGRGADESWTWHGLAALARGDLDTARNALARVEASRTPEVAALRGGLAALTPGGDDRRALQDLDVALSAGFHRPEVRLWRARAILGRGGDRVASGLEALEEIKKLGSEAKELAEDLGPLEVEALILLERRDAAARALAGFTSPRPELAWAIALLGVDEALARGDLDAALASCQVERPPAANPDAAALRRTHRVEALLAPAMQRLRAGTTSEGDMALIEKGLSVIARVAPGSRLRTEMSETLCGAIAIKRLLVPPSLAFLAAELAHDEDDVVFCVAYRYSATERAAEARVETIARRAAAHGPLDRRLAARLCVVRSLVGQGRGDAASQESSALLEAVAAAVARGDLDANAGAELTAEVTFCKARALRRDGHSADAFRLLDTVAPVIARLHAAELVLEKMNALSDMNRDEEALGIGLAALREPELLGKRLFLAEGIWERGARLGRLAELDALSAALDRWNLGREPLWLVRCASVAVRRGETAKALEHLAAARRELDGGGREQLEGIENLVATRDPSAARRLLDLERALVRAR